MILLSAWCLFVVFFRAVTGQCNFPEMIDFENCIWPQQYAASSGFDWTIRSPTHKSYQRAEWTRTQGFPLSYLKKPPFLTEDHTVATDEGYFMLVTRPLRVTGLVFHSDLISPLYLGPTDACNVSFHYQIYLRSPQDKLTLSLTSISTSASQQLWESSGQNTTGWTKVEVALPPMITNFQLTFSAVLKENVSGQAFVDGMISLDDISFSSSCCKGCRRPMRADFECGLQGFTLQSPVSTGAPSAAWKFTAGADNKISRPATDHTLLAVRGHYVWLDSVESKGKTALFTSPVYLPPTGTCSVQFSYFLNVPGASLLSVFLKERGSLGNGQHLMSVRGQANTGWQNATARIQTTRPYQIIFRGVAANSTSSHIALDDISLSRSCCAANAGPQFPSTGCSVGYDTISSQPHASTNLTVVDTFLRFSCKGNVSQVRVQTSGPCSYTFFIWRTSQEERTFYRQAETRKQVSFPGAGRHTAIVSLPFESGDYFGWQHISGSGRLKNSLHLGQKNLCYTSKLEPKVVDHKTAYLFKDCTARINSIAVDVADKTADPTTSILATSSMSSIRSTASTSASVGSTSTRVSASTSTSRTTMTTTARNTATTSSISTTQPPFVISTSMRLEEESSSTMMIAIIAVSAVATVLFILIVIYTAYRLRFRQRRRKNHPSGNPLFGNGTLRASPPLGAVSNQSYEDTINIAFSSGGGNAWPKSVQAGYNQAKYPHTDEDTLLNGSLIVPPDPFHLHSSRDDVARTESNTPTVTQVTDIPHAYAQPSRHCYDTVSDVRTERTTLKPSCVIPGPYETPVDGAKPGWQVGRLGPDMRPPQYEALPRTLSDAYAHLNQHKSVRRLPPSQIDMQQIVGHGEFGTVHAALWKPPGRDPVHVAVKTLQAPKGGMSAEEQRLRFFQEAALMGQFNHKNIVQLIGVITQDPVMIVLELMQDSLKNYLMKALRPGTFSHPDISSERLPTHLLTICQQVADGMVYLHSKAFVHRDLAARNVMVDAETVCKIGDFGHARDVGASNDNGKNYYDSKGGKIAVKWTAPEAINRGRYTESSDVWSFGVLLYEIWSLGAEPYPSLDNPEAFRQVVNGYRLPAPCACPLAVYELMIDCWWGEDNVERRPTFGEIVERLNTPDRAALLYIDKSMGKAATLGSGSSIGQRAEAYRRLQCRYQDSGHYEEVCPDGSSDEMEEPSQPSITTAV